MNAGGPLNNREKQNDFPLVRRPPSAVEKAAPGAKRIVADMVADTLALMSARTNAEAEGWFEKGNSYFESDNYTEAMRWYRKAAEQNHAEAQYALGRCYEMGEGVVKDQAEAVKWYRKAAEQGDADAQYRLGMCYQDGRGVVKDEAKAEKWQDKARDQWRKSAEDRLEVAHVDLDALVRKAKKLYNSDEWTEENWQANELFLRAAEEGHGEAQFLVFKCSQHLHSVLSSVDECGLQIDKTAPIEWLRKSAESGFAEGQRYLGACYENGDGVPQNYTEAVAWYRKAAEQGDADAQYALANSYYYGRGVTKDYVEAVKWCRKAAERGHANAQYMLGGCLATGQGGEDFKEGVDWLRKAAEQGNEGAKQALQFLRR